MTSSALAHLPDEGPVELLFVLLHGASGSAADMAPLIARLAAEYPQAALVSLNAPGVMDGAGPESTRRQWFPSLDLTEANQPGRVAAALPQLVAMVRQLQQRFDLPWERTALAGFGQGAVMVLEAVQAEPRLAGRVLAFSGRHATAPTHAPEDTTVHLFHGLNDTVIPPGPAIDAAERFVALGGDVTADVLPGVSHALDRRLLDKAMAQLRSFLPKKVWRQAMSEAPILARAASSAELDIEPVQRVADRSGRRH